jgi:hypothetical protein
MKRLRPLILLLLAALLLGGAGFSARAAEIHLPDLPSWTTDGEQTGSDYGYAVSAAGDVNGDGLDDILIGAPLYESGVYREGVVYGFYGSEGGLNQTANWMVGSGQTGARFGAALASAGDVDGDGYDDVFVGAPRYNDGQPTEGAAFLYLGSADGLQVTPVWSVQGEISEFELGYAVDGAGDLNGDDYLDLVIGVHHFTDGQSSEGQVRVYYGSSSGFESGSYWSYVSNQSGATLGAAVAGLGDVNGDGYDDLAVGAPYYNDTATDAGAVFVFYGSETGLSAAYDWYVAGGTENEKFGMSVAAAGDLNQDGFADLLVGVPGYGDDLTDQGAVFVYLGSASGLAEQPAVIWKGGQTGSDFGYSVASAGDLNHDGLLDCLVGAPFYTNDQQTEGGIFVFYGRKQELPSAYDWRNYGNKAEASLGFSVAAAGDVDGDGYGDILAGAPTYRVNHVIVGRAVGYYGEFDPVYWQLYMPLTVKQGSGE